MVITPFIVFVSWVVPSKNGILELRRGYFDRPRFWLVRLQFFKKVVAHKPIKTHPDRDTYQHIYLS